MSLRSGARRWRAGIVAALTGLLAVSMMSPVSATPYGESLESVINYLPAERGAFVGSPTLVVMHDGSYIAANDRFGSGSDAYGAQGSRFTEVFRSDDKGATWNRISVVEPLFWSTVFEQDGVLYLMGVGAKEEYDNAVIYRSTDRGETWEGPSVLLSGTYHTGATPVVINKGRVYKTYEQYMGGSWGQFEALVISADIHSNLMDPASWTRSNNNSTRYTLEGNPVVTPDGKILDILRWHYYDQDAMVTELTDDNTLVQVGAQSFPRGVSVNKFFIIYDKVSGKYLMAGNPQTKDIFSGLNFHRNILALYESDDALNWKFVRVLVDDDEGFSWEQNTRKSAFSYPTIQIDGDDLLLVSRTAYGAASSNHDTNRMTFHRFPQFRLGLGTGDLVAHYTFDDASQPGRDFSPTSGTDGTLVAGTVTSEGKFGSAFSPATGGISLGNSLHPTLWDATGLSAAAWVKASSLDAPNQVIVQTAVNAMDTGMELALSSAGLRAEVRSSKDSVKVVRTVPYPADGEWHHVAMSANLADGTFDLYIDGVAQQPADRSVNFGSTTYMVSNPQVNDRIGSATFGAPFRGQIDDLRIYRTALGDSAVQKLANPSTVSLSGVHINGEPLATFSATLDVVDATIDAASASVALQTPDGVTASPASFTVNLDSGATTARKVTLTDGTTTRVVTIRVNRPQAVSSDTELSRIALSDGSQIPLLAGIRDYSVDVVIRQGSTPPSLSVVAVLAQHPKATAQVVSQPDLSAAEPQAVIRVTAEDGTQSDYIVNINVQRTKLVGHWNFQEPGPVYADHSLFTHNASAVGNVTSIQGPVGNAVELPGAAGSYVNLGTVLSNSLNGTDAITITGWVRRDTVGTAENNWIMGSRISGTGAGVEMLFNGANLRVAGRSVSSDGYQRLEYPYPNDGKWHFVAGVLDFSGKKIRAYIDGQEVQPVQAGTVTFKSATYQATSGTQPDRIGASPANIGYFDGGLDEIKVWSAALTPQEIADQYSVADVTSLNAVIAQAQAVDRSLYTADSLAALDQALAAAQAVAGASSPTQADVDDAMTALQEAITGLVPIPPVVDPTPIPDGDGNVFFQDTVTDSVARTAMQVASADQVLVGDWDGDGIDTLALRNGTQYMFLATNRTGAAHVTVDLGTGIPIVGDFNGDGKDDIALRAADSNLFSITYNVEGAIPAGVVDETVHFGKAADTPVAGDWDGDGKATLGVQRENKFLLSNTLAAGAADVSFYYGQPGDKPIIGDFDGNGSDSIAVARDIHVFVKNSLTKGDADFTLRFGRTSDVRVAGDWFGSGTDTLAAVRG